MKDSGLPRWGVVVVVATLLSTLAFQILLAGQSTPCGFEMDETFFLTVVLSVGVAAFLPTRFLRSNNRLWRMFGPVLMGILFGYAAALMGKFIQPCPVA